MRFLRTTLSCVIRLTSLSRTQLCVTLNDSCSVCEILGLTSSSTRKSSIAMIYDDIFLSTECCNSALLELRRKHSIPQNDKPLPIKSTVGTAHQWRSEKENGCTSKQPRVHLLNFCNQSATIVIRLCFYPKFQDDICSKIL